MKKQVAFYAKEILDHFCLVYQKNEFLIDIRYFLLIANSDTYNVIINYVVQKMEDILKTNETVLVHLNMMSFTLTHIDKHYSFIKNVCIFFQEKFPDKLEKCFVYHASFLFSQLIKILSKFVDKKTREKIVLVKE